MAGAQSAEPKASRPLGDLQACLLVARALLSPAVAKMAPKVRHRGRWRRRAAFASPSSPHLLHLLAARRSPPHAQISG